MGLNPSTANELQDDPTIRRLCGFAEDWGYGGLYACNLYPYITAYPKELVKGEAHHKANYPAIKMASSLSVLIVVGWGDGIKLVYGGAAVAEHVGESYLSAPMCFGLTQLGNPKHPLYLSKGAELMEFVK